MNLIMGNHDFYTVLEYEKFGLICFQAHKIDPFTLVHDIPENKLSENKVLLSAFGNFIGTHNIKPDINDLIFPILDGTVITIDQ
tara:strand:+ start:5182 stop:5433 length:252 start_codon:yes stop_codon:yes gene_type:complete